MLSLRSRPHPHPRLRPRPYPLALFWQMNLDRWGRREWVIALPLQGIFTHADPWKYKETAQ